MSQFKALNWTPAQKVGESQMDTLTGNIDWLYNNTPRAVYTLPSGLTRAEGVRMASGRALITKRKSDDATVTVRFGNFFSANCQPLITTGIVSEGQKKIFCVINGIDTLHPDNRGFQILVNIAASGAKDKIARSFYVSWHALGY